MKLEADIIPRVDLTNKWAVLQDLWSQTVGLGTVSFTKEQEGFYIRECIEELSFQMRRDFITNQRYTDVDKYGLLGLSLIDLNDRSVIITEGVSDYFTAKICNPTSNVLGVTNLGGSVLARKILISLFDFVTICMDNDPTGITNGMKWRSLFEFNGIKVDLYLPEAPNKDITDEFLFNIKLNK